VRIIETAARAAVTVNTAVTSTKTTICSAMDLKESGTVTVGESGLRKYRTPSVAAHSAARARKRVVADGECGAEVETVTCPASLLCL
jgi:hypothetical protein